MRRKTAYLPPSIKNSLKIHLEPLPKLDSNRRKSVGSKMKFH
jgi:hypothetical protein